MSKFQVRNCGILWNKEREELAIIKKSASGHKAGDVKMSVLNQITVTRKMGTYFRGKIPGSPSCLLKAVRQAVEDIKKEEPCVTGLNVAEISFLCNREGEICLKVYFE
jgi:hypothetical protein